MKILIGVIGNDAARFHLFTASVMKLDTKGLDVDREMLIGGDWCSARNELAQMALDGDYTHLWFMDDDHAFAPDLLKRLASHNVPLITPLCLARVAPFPLVSYALTEDRKAHLPIDLAGVPGEGLVEIHAGGCAGMLIAREVLEATRSWADEDKVTTGKWFEYGEVSEDVLFCAKARECGFKLYADLGARLGHITTAVVYPDIDNGTWMTRLKIGGGLDLFVSQAQDWKEEEQQLGEAFEPLPDPERIEVWMDADGYWWWRVIPAEGDMILAKGSGVREDQVIADAQAAFPGLEVHIVQRELDDSRHPKQYGPPARLWNRGDE